MNKLLCYLTVDDYGYPNQFIEERLCEFGIRLDNLSGERDSRKTYFVVKDGNSLWLYNDLSTVDLRFTSLMDKKLFKIPLDIIHYMIGLSKSKSIEPFLKNAAADKSIGGFNWAEHSYINWSQVINECIFDSFYKYIADNKYGSVLVDASNLCDCSSLITTEKITSISSDIASGTNGLIASPYKENIDTLYKTLTNINNKENENRLQEQGSTVLRGCRQQQGGVCGRRRKIAIRVKPISYKAVIGRG